MQTKPYPQYKESGIEWIGKIPNNWKLFKLKHVINEFVAGGTPQSSNELFWTNFDETGIPWVAINDMSTTDYVNTTKKEITNDGLHSKNLKILKKGTLIYSIFATLGKVSILNIDATTNQAILGLIINNKINKMYLKYYLNYIEDKLELFSNLNTQNNLNTNIIKNIEITLPTLDEQEQIAKYLDTQTTKIQKTITKNKQLITLLKEKRTTLINQTVTKGLNPETPMKETGIQWIGKIPEHWEIIRLKHIVSKVNSGATPKGGSEIYVKKGIPLIRSQNVQIEGLKLDNVVYITKGINKTMNNSIVKKGDVLLNITGASIGRCAFVNNINIANVNQHVCIIRPINKIFYKYLTYYLNSDFGQTQIFSIQMGTSREAITFEEINNFKITLPNLKEQKKL